MFGTVEKPGTSNQPRSLRILNVQLGVVPVDKGGQEIPDLEALISQDDTTTCLRVHSSSIYTMSDIDAKVGSNLGFIFLHLLGNAPQDALVFVCAKLSAHELVKCSKEIGISVMPALISYNSTSRTHSINVLQIRDWGIFSGSARNDFLHGMSEQHNAALSICRVEALGLL